MLPPATTFDLYRPQIGVHAVSRLSDGERPADDQALALTEQFMGLCESRFLDVAVRLLSPTCEQRRIPFTPAG